ncbi:MAG: hypothetical protein B7Y39_16720 [Bdellovibrio sp. 28-41-41]|nr:MAG: hypothetical protein B7Y39_16720 [Bdellovibrio sp. 28-41-41]
MNSFTHLIQKYLFLLTLVGSLFSMAESVEKKVVPKNPLDHKVRPHLDHSAFFKKPITSPQEITLQCLSCHKDAAHQVMQTPHWTWTSGDVVRNGKSLKTGKKNLMNNFCISVSGNWASCAKCHAGYGWKDKNFDFTKKENVDCLICHDGSGTYSKGKEGMPDPKLDLAAVARSVRVPYRENCGTCHFNGGGGMGVKHGDLDDSLLNASEETDVHMGRLNFQCIDCHKTKEHLIPGKVNATYTELTKAERFDCTKCHTEKPHKDHRINEHISRVACQTCHIPEFARKYPTKMEWDWSQAGNSKHKENPHEYLKIKGSFKYDEGVIPEYAWYNGKMNRYITGDKLDSEKDHAINEPLGARQDLSAKIWPFKVHHAKQIYDPINQILIPPITSGEGGYWSKFDWSFAAKKGAEVAELPYSGKYAFTSTHMYWPINHMTAPAKKSLSCKDCHSPSGRLDWKLLGYEKDPVSGKKSPYKRRVKEK